MVILGTCPDFVKLGKNHLIKFFKTLQNILDKKHITIFKNILTSPRNCLMRSG